MGESRIVGTGLANVLWIILAGIYLTRPIFAFIHHARLREMYTALALLIELKRNALKKKKTISFIYLPQSLLKIASLSQVEDLLNEKAS